MCNILYILSRILNIKNIHNKTYVTCIDLNIMKNMELYL